MNPTNLEQNLSRVFQLLDELDGVRSEPASDAWNGYDKRAYSKASQDVLDQKVAELCNRLRTDSRIAERSLELQLWWRDHQRADAERERRDDAKRTKQAIKDKALKKLTDAEKVALRLK